MVADAMLECLALPDARRVVIRSLGGFAVERAGMVVGPREWQSRKARDLLKILICRRGRPVTREALVEALWPDQDPARTANRLAVALSTVRAVLDPRRRFGSGHFIVADRCAVRLEREHVVVDVERFFADAHAGLACHRSGRPEEGRALLAAAEAVYRGDFLEEDLYEEWAVSLREEARAAYVAVAGALAELAGADGDHEAAVRLRLRVLERDAYDEGAHVALIASLTAAGRHGDALCARRRYRARMREIGIPPRAASGGARSTATSTPLRMIDTTNG
jgi:DNA-binding SARP family transcriptional activator